MTTDYGMYKTRNQSPPHTHIHSHTQTHSHTHTHTHTHIYIDIYMYIKSRLTDRTMQFLVSISLPLLLSPLFSFKESLSIVLLFLAGLLACIQSRCFKILAGRSIVECPNAGIHRKLTQISLSLLHQDL